VPGLWSPRLVPTRRGGKGAAVRAGRPAAGRSQLAAPHCPRHRRGRKTIANRIKKALPPTASALTPGCQTQQAFFYALHSGAVRPPPRCTRLARGGMGRLFGALPIGADPTQHRHVGHVQHPPDGAPAPAFQIPLQRELPLLVGIRPPRSARVVITASPAAVALLATQQPVFTARRAATSGTLPKPKLTKSTQRSNAQTGTNHRRMGKDGRYVMVALSLMSASLRTIGVESNAKRIFALLSR
jgi:hypothetical protein